MDYIYINEYSICSQLCNEIIQLYESNKEKQYKGVTMGGLQSEIKDTTDYIIPNNDNKDWNKINEFLKKELILNVKEYIKKINSFVSTGNNYGKKYNFISDIDQESTIPFLQFDSFMIQKYEKEQGKYIFHTDNHVDFYRSRYRIFTFIWYLNNVECGGETLFWDTYRVKPTSGKLVLFPACWTFPHSGQMPISGDKYIITGWIYVNNNKNVIKKVNELNK